MSFDFSNSEKFKASGFSVEGRTINGLVTEDGTVIINANSSKALDTVVGHEIMHLFEGTEFYDAVAEAVVKLAKTKGEYQTRYDEIAKLYENVKNADVNKELVADLVGDYLFSDSEFIERLSTEHRNVFQKIYDEIKYFCKIAAAGSKEARELEKVRKAFEKAYRETTEIKNTAEGGVRFSITSDSQGRYVKIDVNQSVFDGKNTKEMQVIARNIIKNKFKGKVLAVGKNGKAYVNKRSAEEYAYPANRRMSDTIKEAKMRSSAELDNLLAVSNFIENQSDDGRHPEAIGGWDVYATRFEVANTMFSGEVKIMVTDRGFVFYDITKIKRLPVNGGQTDTNSVAASGSLSIDSISNSTENVNTKDVYGFKINETAKVNEDLLEELSIWHPDAQVDTEGNITVYHRTSKANAEKIRQTGVMTAKEDALFFSSKSEGYASDYGDTVLSFKIPSTVLQVNDIFDGEVHFDMPLKYKNGGFSADVSRYLIDDNANVKEKYSLSAERTTKKYGNVYGEDILLEKDEDIGPVREDVAPVKQPETRVEDVAPFAEKKKEYISFEDFENKESPVWRNVDYNDASTQQSITSEIHNKMLSDGRIVEVSDDVKTKVAESYPDLRTVKKKERTPILKEAMNKLKDNIREFLSGFKNQGFEFEVNGKVLEAKLYNTGINEVLEKITQEKADMLYSTEDIFRNACYLYSTPDYAGDTNVYRWNYFYTPVKIGENIVGVRIAVRDVKTGTKDHLPESQIYNWGIKKDTSLNGESYGPKVASSDVSSDVSEDIIPQMEQNVNTEDIGPVREDVVTKTEVDERLPMLDENDFAPISEEDALRNADEEQTNSLTDEDMPPEKEEVFYLTDTTSIDEKSLKNISAMGKDILFLNMKERRTLEDVVQKYRLFS